ncbi:hypothetical protein KQI89_15955 [Clostridium sp. MSJ-4]|uniref:Uncharacterized protein n=1 Tax=Clostridium simiarum TaxID=2841506 RepID=A0ABS6F6K8_9CLOT|nr:MULTISPECIES: hypothetical protein [Clostridium]MBU5593243.1 hypothetical protein [Clostridium simiarum]
MEMNNPNDARDKARDMLIAGEDWDRIREVTNLRLKDLKRIQKEITEHF